MHIKLWVANWKGSDTMGDRVQVLTVWGNGLKHDAYPITPLDRAQESSAGHVGVMGCLSHSLFQTKPCFV